MQKCKTCQIDKPLEDFEASPFVKADGQPSRRRVCRKCVYKARRGTPGSEQYQKAIDACTHYRNNKGRLKVAERLAWVDAQKARPCEDCNNSFPPECMDFDHIDPKLKSFSISAGVLKLSLALDTVAQEIAKCRLICANCHRIRTAKQHRRGWVPEKAEGKPRAKKYGRITKEAR